MVIVIGKTLKKIDKCLVLINGVKYEAASTLEAIDRTFKSFYSLQVDYAPVANNIWVFIQKYLYGIDVAGESIPQTVTTLMNTLKYIK